MTDTTNTENKRKLLERFQLLSHEWQSKRGELSKIIGNTREDFLRRNCYNERLFPCWEYFRELAHHAELVPSRDPVRAKYRAVVSYFVDSFENEDQAKGLRFLADSCDRLREIEDIKSELLMVMAVLEEFVKQNEVKRELTFLAATVNNIISSMFRKLDSCSTAGINADDSPYSTYLEGLLMLLGLIDDILGDTMLVMTTTADEKNVNLVRRVLDTRKILESENMRELHSSVPHEDGLLQVRYRRQAAPSYEDDDLVKHDIAEILKDYTLSPEPGWLRSLPERRRTLVRKLEQFLYKKSAFLYLDVDDGRVITNARAFLSEVDEFRESLGISQNAIFTKMHQGGSNMKHLLCNYRTGNRIVDHDFLSLYCDPPL